MSTFPRGRREQGSRFGSGRLLLCLTLSGAWFLALRPAIDPDYGWHIENGRRVLDGSAFAGRDLYSWTASGEWVVHEWLVEAAMSVAHDSLGATANSILAALLWTFAFFLVALRLRKRGFSWVATNITVVLAFLCTMMSAGVRPQVLELVYLAALLVLIDRHRAGLQSDASFLAAVVAGMVLWVNTHGSFPLLIAILGACVAGAVLQRERTWRVYAMVGLAAGLAALANPWVWDSYAFATQSMTSQPTLQSIDEWKRPRLSSGSLLPFDLAAVLAVAGALTVVRWRLRGTARGQPLLPPLSDVTIFLGVSYLGLTSGRHVMLFGIGSAPLIAWSIASILRRVRTARAPENQPITPELRRGKEVINLVAAAAVVVVVAITGWEVVKPAAQARAMAARYPVDLVDDLRTLARSPGRMFNEYSWGGFLIANAITPVFIDGRSELYGDAQLVRYAQIIRLSSGWKEVMDTLGVNVAVIRRNSPLAARLEGDGWKVVAIDSVGVALVK